MILFLAWFLVGLIGGLCFSALMKVKTNDVDYALQVGKEAGMYWSEIVRQAMEEGQGE